MEEDHGVSQLNGPRCSPNFLAPTKNQPAGTSYICTYMGCGTKRNFTRNHSYLFYPWFVAKILDTNRANKEIHKFNISAGASFEYAVTSKLAATDPLWMLPHTEPPLKAPPPPCNMNPPPPTDKCPSQQL